MAFAGRQLRRLCTGVNKRSAGSMHASVTIYHNFKCSRLTSGSPRKLGASTAPLRAVNPPSPLRPRTCRAWSFARARPPAAA